MTGSSLDRDLREQRMRAYRAAGLTTGQIARQVGVTTRTVLRVLGPDQRAAQPKAYGEGSCATCSRRQSAVNLADRDFRLAVHKAASDPTPWRLRLIEVARASLDSAKQVLNDHHSECDSGGAA